MARVKAKSFGYGKATIPLIPGGHYRNSYDVLQLSESGLWVSVPNVSSTAPDRVESLRSLYRNRVERVGDEVVRIVCNYVNNDGTLKEEPKDHRGTVLFTPKPGLVLELGQYANVYVRTFGLLEAHIPPKYDMWEEADAARAAGWLCIVSSTPETVDPLCVLQVA